MEQTQMDDRETGEHGIDQSQEHKQNALMYRSAALIDLRRFG